MIKNAKKVINTKVFKWQTGVYLGKISDIAFSEDGVISGYFMSTDSIVPIDMWIFPGAVRKNEKGKMYVDDISNPRNSEEKTFKKSVKKRELMSGGRKIGKGRDMLFDNETGEIQGFLYSENILRKPMLLEANKIDISGKNKDVKFERSYGK